MSSVRFAKLIPSYDGQWHALLAKVSAALGRAGIDPSQVRQAGSMELGQLVGRVADVVAACSAWSRSSPWW